MCVCHKVHVSFHRWPMMRTFTTLSQLDYFANNIFVLTADYFCRFGYYCFEVLADCMYYRNFAKTKDTNLFMNKKKITKQYANKLTICNVIGGKSKDENLVNLMMHVKSMQFPGTEYSLFLSIKDRSLFDITWRRLCLKYLLLIVGSGVKCFEK